METGHILWLYHIINFLVDPCDTANGGCSQTCTNNNGAATCSCTTGTLNADGHTCDQGILYQHILYWSNIPDFDFSS